MALTFEQKSAAWEKSKRSNFRASLRLEGFDVEMPMKIFIPPLGTVIRLTEDWRFRLYNEHRNETVMSAAKLYPPFREGLAKYPWQDTAVGWRDKSLAEREAEVIKSGWTYEKPDHFPDDHHSNFWTGEWHHEFVFRADTELRFDRLYIRMGQKGFDSVTFRTNCWMSQLGDPLFSAPRKLKALRFWAKLEDVNRIVGDIVVR